MEGKEINYLLDRGASLSVLWFSSGPLSPTSATVTRVTGKPVTQHFLHLLNCSWGALLFSHTFLIVPKSPTTLLVQDILSRLGTSLLVAPGEALLLPAVETDRP